MRREARDCPVVRPSAGIFSVRAHGKRRVVLRLVRVKEREGEAVCGIVDEQRFRPAKNIISQSQEQTQT